VSRPNEMWVDFSVIISSNPPRLLGMSSKNEELESAPRARGEFPLYASQRG
jgi:hypothetical protein